MYLHLYCKTSIDTVVTRTSKIHSCCTGQGHCFVQYNMNLKKKTCPYQNQYSYRVNSICTFVYLYESSIWFHQQNFNPYMDPGSDSINRSWNLLWFLSNCLAVHVYLHKCIWYPLSKTITENQFENKFHIHIIACIFQIFYFEAFFWANSIEWMNACWNSGGMSNNSIRY